MIQISKLHPALAWVSTQPVPQPLKGKPSTFLNYRPMKRCSIVLLVLLLAYTVSAQGFTVVINGTPFAGAVDGQPDAALLEAGKLAEIPGLNVQVEGAQVTVAGKDFPSAYKQGRVMVDAKALTQAAGGIYEVTDVGRTVKLTFRNAAAAPTAQADQAPTNLPTYSYKYFGETPDMLRQAFEAMMSRMLYGIATNNQGMLQSAISSTCHIHGPGGDPALYGATTKPAQIAKIIELLGGQSPTQIKAQYAPKTESFSAIVKYKKYEIQLLATGRYSITEFGLGPLTRL